MNIVSQQLETVAIDAVRPHPENPRRGDVAAITDSIKSNGFVGSLIVQRSSGHILAGTHRWRAAQAVGLTVVPVIWVDVDDAHARRILLADNRTSDRAGYDEEVLLELLADIADDNGLDGSGYSPDDLDALLGAVQDSLTEPEPSEPTPETGKPKKEPERPPAPSGDDAGAGDGAPQKRYFVTVFCENQADQMNLLESLQEDGYEAKAS